MASSVIYKSRVMDLQTVVNFPSMLKYHCHVKPCCQIICMHTSIYVNLSSVWITLNVRAPCLLNILNALFKFNKIILILSTYCILHLNITQHVSRIDKSKPWKKHYRSVITWVSRSIYLDIAVFVCVFSSIVFTIVEKIKMKFTSITDC